jgi:hypothetical protein
MTTQQTADVADIALAPVRKTVTVRANIDDAFRVFAAEMDSWWPRTHHIGKSPMTHVVVEPRTGGRLYSQQQDGTDCDWGRVLSWEPPTRFHFAWMITHTWGYEPDLAKSSEVEVRFTSLGADNTRVDLEHRHFERMGAGAAAMRAGVDDPSGWNGLLTLFASKAGSGAQ